MSTPWGHLSLAGCLLILALFDGLVILSVRKALQRQLS
jgi:hypothetical protein